MEEIRWGIIGCGNVTELKSGPAFNKVTHSKLVAVMRRNGEKAADYALRHGVPKWYNNAQHLIDDKDINAIYIATPPDSHGAYALAAIKAGKRVYIEKPMTLHAGEAQRLVEAAQEQHTKLSVAHYRRAQPYFIKIKELLDAQRIGDVLWIDLRFIKPHHIDMLGADTTWRINPQVSGGGLFHDLAPHQLDLMVYFCGAPQNVTGFAINKGGHYSADDTVTGTALLPKGIVFRGLWNFSAPDDKEEDVCEIIGTKGKLSFSVFGPQWLHLSVNGKTETFSFQPPVHVQQPMIQKVVAYFRGESANPCSALEGLHVMQWMDAFTLK